MPAFVFECYGCCSKLCVVRVDVLHAGGQNHKPNIAQPDRVLQVRLAVRHWLSLTSEFPITRLYPIWRPVRGMPRTSTMHFKNCVMKMTEGCYQPVSDMVDRVRNGSSLWISYFGHDVADHNKNCIIQTSNFDEASNDWAGAVALSSLARSRIAEKKLKNVTLVCVFACCRPEPDDDEHPHSKQSMQRMLDRDSTTEVRPAGFRCVEVYTCKLNHFHGGLEPHCLFVLLHSSAQADGPQADLGDVALRGKARDPRCRVFRVDLRPW